MDPITIGAAVILGLLGARKYTQVVYQRGVKAGRSEVLSLPRAESEKRRVGPFHNVPEAMSIVCYGCSAKYTDKAEEVAKMLAGKRGGICNKCQSDLVPLYRETVGGQAILFNMQVKKELDAMHREEKLAGVLVQPEAPKKEERPPAPPPQKPEEPKVVLSPDIAPPPPQTPMPESGEPPRRSAAGAADEIRYT